MWAFLMQPKSLKHEEKVKDSEGRDPEGLTFVIRGREGRGMEEKIHAMTPVRGKDTRDCRVLAKWGEHNE